MSAASSPRGLGRGFESLIPTDLLDDSFDPTAKQDEQVSELRQLPLKAVQADPDQPRRNFDQAALEDLAASIKEFGVLQPIIVIPNDDSYQIVAGERRYRASKLAGLTTIPALVRTLSAQTKLELSLIENLQRSDLNAIETATAYLKLRDQFNLTLDEIGQRVGGRSGSAVSNTLRLLRLPKSVQRALAEGKLTEGQARPLIGEEEAFVNAILPRILKEEWSARQVEQYMVNIKADRSDSSDTTKPKAAAVDEAKLAHWRERLGISSVAIRTNSAGAGQITIKFRNPEELKEIEERLG